MSEALLTRPVSILPAGTAFSRLTMALGFGGGDVLRTRMAAAMWKDTPTVSKVLEHEDWHTKAAVSPGTTTDATFAGPLISYGVAAEAIAIERGLSVIGALAGRMRRTPFRVHVSRETGSGTGGARGRPQHASRLDRV
jgi:hypothetical protein